MNISEELARLAKLRDEGVLTEEEFQAQKSAVLQGGSGSVGNRPGKGGKIGKGCLIAVAIVIVLIILGVIVGGDKAGTGTTDSSKQATATNPTRVTATELFTAYQANEASAQQTYGDKPLLVSGTVASVDLDLSNNPVVHLRTPNEFMSAAANLTDASKAKASGLSKGQKVEMLCTGISEVMSIPQLSDCDIQ